MRSLAFLLISLFFAVPAQSAREKVRVLLVTGGHGFEKGPFFDIFNKNTNITVTTIEQGKTSSPAYDHPDLLKFEVVVLYDMVQKISYEQKTNFLNLFERGIGLVVLHHALVSYQDWPEFERVIGGTYPEDQTKKGKVSEALGYQHDVDIPIVVVQKNHPVTKGVSDFILHDEIYWGYRVAKDVTPLLTTPHLKSGKPLAWARQEKKSKVVYLQSGHGPSAYNNPNFQRLVAQAIEWVTPAR